MRKTIGLLLVVVLVLTFAAGVITTPTSQSLVADGMLPLVSAQDPDPQNPPVCPDPLDYWPCNIPDDPPIGG